MVLFFFYLLNDLLVFVIVVVSSVIYCMIYLLLLLLLLALTPWFTTFEHFTEVEMKLTSILIFVFAFFIYLLSK